MQALHTEVLRKRAILLLAAVVIAAMTLALAPTSFFGNTHNPLIHIAHAKKAKKDKKDTGPDIGPPGDKQDHG
jgi:hypothetical protein